MELATPTHDDAIRDLDKVHAAALAGVTGGLSPESMLLAWADWAVHLAGAPGKQLELALQAARLATDEASGDALARDPRFAAAAWQREPYRSWALAFLRTQDWWRSATRGVPGTEAHHEALVSFFGRQWLDLFAPSNLPWSNPEVLERTAHMGGLNLWQGGVNLWQDLWRQQTGQGPVGSEDFVIGRDIACTPGRVVLRNELIELIQYAPATPTVHAEPVLMIPAWIMKYYILDLSPQDSLVRWLVGQGHTVFCISWRNVTQADRGLSFDDYRRLGVMAALDAIGTIVPKRRVHALGYCLGGTLLAMTAAAMARRRDERLASVTLLAAQTDFSEPGELQLFIDAAQVHLLDSMMWERGFLRAEQMSGAFQMLRSRDLIWSRIVREYLLGERPPLTDLMAWNADSTRMPARMHSEYLHRLFLGNDLAAGRLLVDGHPVALQNIRVPLFVVGTETDHVSPWRSVYKIHYLADTEVSFVLTNGGHNAGIVSEPGHPHRHFRLTTRPADAPCLDADEWLAGAPVHEGSWWPAWANWLQRRSTPRRTPPPPMGSARYPALADAPGSFVLQR